MDRDAEVQVADDVETDETEICCHQTCMTISVIIGAIVLASVAVVLALVFIGYPGSAIIKKSSSQVPSFDPTFSPT
jgi:hypothetical protein